MAPSVTPSSRTRYLPLIEVSGIQVVLVVLGLLDLLVEVIVVQIHYVRHFIATIRLRHLCVLILFPVKQRKIW